MARGLNRGPFTLKRSIALVGIALRWPIHYKWVADATLRIKNKLDPFFKKYIASHKIYAIYAVCSVLDSTVQCIGGHSQ